VRDPNPCAALLSLTVNQPTQLNLRKIEALQTEIAQLDARAADHRADFELERADRLMLELLQTPTGTVVEADRKASRYPIVK
jgi:hypothetical protein